MANISVIMGVYNCATTLPDAINSILNQTVTDWELIICDDGSQDNTLQIAWQYQHSYPDKIIVLANEKNLGLNKTLNKCLKISTGNYIARMDGDDICAPERFKEELEVLEYESDIAIVSTDMNLFDSNGVWGKVSSCEYPNKFDFLRGTPFCHAPCMVRREAYEAVQGYSDERKFLRVEDYHLWLKMYEAGFKGKNIPKTLYSMRDDRAAYHRRKFKYRLNEAYVRALAIKKLALPLWGFVFVLRPIAVGLLPGFLYDILHKHKQKQNINRCNSQPV